MALIRKIRGHEPVVGENTFLAETAVLLGDVTVGRDCSIWYNAVLRGDVNKIVVGDRTNIQDGVVLHTIYDGAKHPSQTIIGNDVSIGHNAVVHGARIGDNCLIGMGSILLDNAVEALAGSREIPRKIHLEIINGKEGLFITAANTSRPLSTEEMTLFFQEDYTSKGGGRGIGLKKLKKMVYGMGGNIIVSGEPADEAWYIKFELAIPGK